MLSNKTKAVSSGLHTSECMFLKMSQFWLLIGIGLCCSEMKVAESKPGKEEIVYLCRYLDEKEQCKNFSSSSAYVHSKCCISFSSISAAFVN